MSGSRGSAAKQRLASASQSLLSLETEAGQRRSVWLDLVDTHGFRCGRVLVSVMLNLLGDRVLTSR